MFIKKSEACWFFILMTLIIWAGGPPTCMFHIHGTKAWLKGELWAIKSNFSPKRLKELWDLWKHRHRFRWLTSWTLQHFVVPCYPGLWFRKYFIHIFELTNLKWVVHPKPNTIESKLQVTRSGVHVIHQYRNNYTLIYRCLHIASDLYAHVICQNFAWLFLRLYVFRK